MITLQIQDLQALAVDVALEGQETLVFARFALRSPEEARALRHALQKGKLMHSDVGFLAAPKGLVQTWVASRQDRGVTSWILTAYTPELEGKRYFVWDSRAPAEITAAAFAAFLHQHTPYPVPPLPDVGAILRRHGRPLPSLGGGNTRVHAFTEEQIIQILEATAS